MAYCTGAVVLSELVGVDLSPIGEKSAQDAAVAEAIAAADREIETRCRRTFVPPAAPESRIFDGGGNLLMRVPDMVRLDAVAVGGSEIASAMAYPSDGPPYRWIATGARFPVGYRNVAVTALWGFAPEVPGDIARASACLAAADVLGKLQAERSGGVRAQAAGSMREEFPDGGPYADRIAALTNTANRLLIPYRRWVV